VGAILLFDLLTLVTYPAIGTLLGLSDTVFGVWAGTSMFSTGPVVAATIEFSPEAGQWAILSKLARNSMLGVIVVGCAICYADRDASVTRRTLWDSFPKFVL
jgi:uncharacterized membrane protein YadS